MQRTATHQLSEDDPHRMPFLLDFIRKHCIFFIDLRAPCITESRWWVCLFVWLACINLFLFPMLFLNSLELKNNINSKNKRNANVTHFEWISVPVKCHFYLRCWCRIIIKWKYTITRIQFIHIYSSFAACNLDALSQNQAIAFLGVNFLSIVVFMEMMRWLL